METTIVKQGRGELARLFKGIGVEVGVERAVFAKMICSRNPDTKLYGVDPWRAYREYREHVTQKKLDDFYEETLRRMKGFNFHPIRKFSVVAAKDFEDESLDFVYIDANHDFWHVLEDMKSWYPKVKKGGILAGHDYVRRKGQDHIYGVVPAVKEFVVFNKITGPLTIWKGDKSPSWSFIK